MKKTMLRKKFAVLISICMIFQILGGNGGMSVKTADAEVIFIGEETGGAVTGSAITYFVGGEAASDTNDGLSVETPFASIAQATDTINLLGSGIYDIKVQGDTTETRLICIGSEFGTVNVNISNAATGSAIIMRDTSYTDTLIEVNNFSSLTLGDSTGVNKNELIFDGGKQKGIIAVGRMIDVDTRASLILYPNIVICNNAKTSTEGNGGGIRNDGTFTMYGGSITGNYASSGGGVQNYNTFYLYGGSINNNQATYGGGIKNYGLLELYGGTIDSNIAVNGGGIDNDYTIKIIEATISNNNATAMGGGIYESGMTEMTGGTIISNTAAYGGAIYNERGFIISGQVSIPAGATKSNDIYIVRPLLIRSTLYITEKIVLTPDTIWENKQMIDGYNEAITAQSISCFELLAPDYIINNLGYLVNTGPVAEYHVGADQPYATIDAALTANNGLACKIVIHNDLVMTNTVEINGRVTIVSDGSTHTLSWSAANFGSLFYVYNGTLVLGNEANTDSSDMLVLDGKSMISSNVAIEAERDSVLNIYAGVVIKNFDETAIYNSGRFHMFGGNINNCEGEAAVYNDGQFTMTGGSIHDNSGIGVINYIDFSMNGGTISNNGVGGISNNGNLAISGDPVLTTGIANAYGIYLESHSDITIGSNLGDNFSVLIDMSDYYEGRTVLLGASELIKNNNDKFSFLKGDGRFGISETGLLEYRSNVITYYVNEEFIGTSDGSKVYPFKTIDAAVQAIDVGVGNIVLMSDATVNQAIIIKGTINLLSDGEVRTIIRGTDSITQLNIGYGEFGINDMFDVSGKFTLGNKNYSGSDLEPTLILDGGKEQGILESGALIYNLNIVEIYPGVVLQNNDSTKHYSTAITNLGFLKMDGGSIRNNSGDFAGIFSYGEFIMNGGTIKDNTGEVSGVFSEGGSILITGGTITKNTGSNVGVIAMDTDVMMSGGDISGNIAVGEYESISGVTILDGSFNMTGGSIHDNTGFIAGVYLIGEGHLKSLNTVSMMKVSINLIPTGFEMSGGSITGNIGAAMAGVCAGLNTYFEMLGGKVGGNKGAICSGVLGYDGNATRLGGAAVIESDNEIVLLGGWNNYITIMSPLTTLTPIKVKIVLMEEEMFSKSIIVIGQQILKSSTNYHFSVEDSEKFMLSDPMYGINPQGKVGYAIKGSWVTSSDTNDLIYDGTSKSISIKIANQSRTLVLNKDYTLSYYDNINQGAAQVVIRGIGDYAGKIVNGFTIQKAVVKRLLSENPANLTFKASDNKTAEQLIASISLTQALVETQTGTITLPVVWHQSGGVYNLRGGTYSYIGTIIGGNNVDTKGLTLTTQIKVVPVKPQGEEVINIGSGNNLIPVNISYNTARGSFDIEVSLPTDMSYKIGKKLSIPLSTENIIDQIKIMDETKVNISVTLSDSLLNNAGANLTELLLTNELLQAAKDAGKDVTITIYDEDGRERYSWTFTAEELAHSEEDVTEVNLFLEVTNPNSDKDLLKLLEDSNTPMENSLVINFGHDGVLPSQAGIRLYVGDQPGMTEGSTIYLYHYNPVTGKLETLPFSSGYVVDKDGYVTLEILHCSDYVILPEEADSSIITSLKNQIKVTASLPILFVGGTKDLTASIMINLPPTLELVDSLEDQTSGTAIGGVIATYRSGNKKIATVDETGVITAKGVGTVSMFTTVTLYSGKTKTFITTIKVREPYITFSESITSMKRGASFTFKVKAYGVELKDIVWTTTKKSILTINKKTGKAIAISKGTDYVVATIGSEIKKIKVVVK